MALSNSPEKGLFVKKTVYVDMDGVLVDFNSGVNRLPTKTSDMRPLSRPEKQHISIGEVKSKHYLCRKSYTQSSNYRKALLQQTEQNLT